MAGKDVGLYRESGGGTNLTSSAADLALDTTDRQDSGYSRSGGTVTASDARHRLCFYGTRLTEDGGGATGCLLELKADSGSGFATLKGGTSYGTFDNNDGVDDTNATGLCLIDGAADEDYKLTATLGISGDTADEVADSTFLRLLDLPQAFDVCLLENTSDDTGIGNTFAYCSWSGTATIIDTDTFALASNGGIQVKADGRYLIGCNIPFCMETDPAGGPTVGVMYHTVASLNATSGNVAAGERLDYSFQRKTAQWDLRPNNSANLCTFQFEDLSTNDVIRIHRRLLNLGDATDTVDALMSKAQFFLIKIDGGTPAADAIRVRRTSSATSWTGTQTIDWNTGILSEGSSFTHSTSTNPSRVTLPTARVLCGLKLGLNRSSGVDNTAAWLSRFRADGSTVLGHGAGNSGVNLGDPAGAIPVQNQSDVCLGTLFDASGEYVEVQTVEEGTAADANSTLRGGADGWGSHLWMVNIDDWAGDPQTIALGVAAATAASPALGVSPGPISVALGAAAATGAAPSLTAAPGPLSVALGAAQATGAGAALSISAGPITVSLGAATATAAVPSLTVILPGEGDFYEAASNACRSRWKALVADGLSLLTHYDGLPFGRPATLYARVSVEFDDATMAAVSGVGRGILIEAEGRIRAKLLQPSTQGAKPALDKADAIMAAFRDLRDTTAVGDDVVTFREPRVVRRANLGPRYLVELELPFHAEQTAAVSARVTPNLGLDEQDMGTALRTLWKSSVADVVPLPTQYDAMPFTPPNASIWARLTIREGDAVHSAEVHRRVGVLIAQVLTPTETGEKGGLEAVDLVNRTFRHREIQGVRTGAPRVGAPRRDGPWIQHTISVPWQADLIS